MGSVPTKAQRLNYNALMRDIELSGIRSAIVSLGLAGETLDQSVLDIIDPDLTPVNHGMVLAPKQHFAGDAATQWLDTGFNPSAEGVPQNNFAFGGYIRNNLQTANAFGCSDVVGGNGCLLTPRNASNQAAVRVNSATSNNIASQSDSRGLVMAHRSASNTINYYRNGATPGGGSQNSVGVPNEKLAIGAVGRNPVITFNAYQYGGWAALVNPTANVHLWLYRIFQRYFTDMGAAV
jgi:hypothetical protein